MTSTNFLAMSEIAQEQVDPEMKARAIHKIRSVQSERAGQEMPMIANGHRVLALDQALQEIEAETEIGRRLVLTFGRERESKPIDPEQKVHALTFIRATQADPSTAGMSLTIGSRRLSFEDMILEVESETEIGSRIVQLICHGDLEPQHARSPLPIQSRRSQIEERVKNVLHKVSRFIPTFLA